MSDTDNATRAEQMVDVRQPPVSDFRGVYRTAEELMAEQAHLAPAPSPRAVTAAPRMHDEGPSRGTKARGRETETVVATPQEAPPAVRRAIADLSVAMTGRGRVLLGENVLTRSGDIYILSSEDLDAMTQAGDAVVAKPQVQKLRPAAQKKETTNGR